MDKLNELLADPLLLLQMVYYILSAISIIAAAFGFAKNRKLKSLTSLDIGNKVADKASEFNKLAEDKINEFKAASISAIENVLTGVVEKITATNTAVVKAVILANSKAENASKDLLNVLQEVSNTDVKEIVNSAKKAIDKSVAETQKKAISKTEQKNQMLKELDNVNTNIKAM